MRRIAHAAGCVLACGLTAAAAAACGGDPPAAPVATPRLALGATRVVLGGPLEMTFRFEVDQHAPPFPDYHVLVHVLDPDGRLMWALDHDPPTPTVDWQPGQTIEYSLTEFLPIAGDVGPASIYVGLYDAATQMRAPLAGDDNGQRAYRVAGIELLPSSAATAVVFDEGWHAPEPVGTGSGVPSQWSRRDATLLVANPRGNAVLYLQLDQPGAFYTEPQEVTVSIGDETLDAFTLEPGRPELRRVPITAAQFGDEDTGQIGLHVDDAFVPALLADTPDSRELGVRVLQVWFQPQAG